jgi:hypothetical protein
VALVIAVLIVAYVAVITGVIRRHRRRVSEPITAVDEKDDDR